jgi:hypothetical protein
MKVISFYQQKVALLIAVMFLLSGCNSNIKNNSNEETPKANDALGIPLPKWNKDLEELRREYKKKYNAEEVRFTRPYFYVSKEDYSYWLKIFFLNPDYNDKTLEEFGKDVALTTLQHLKNPEDFEKIEIAITQKTGFGITFSKNENIIFYTDSLQMN